MRAWLTYDPQWIQPPELVGRLRDVGYSARDPRKVANDEAEKAEPAEDLNRFLVGFGSTLVTLELMAARWAGHPAHVDVGGRAWPVGPWLILGVALAMILLVAGPIHGRDDFLAVSTVLGHPGPGTS